MAAMLYENGYQSRMPSGGTSLASYFHPCSSLLSNYLDYPTKLGPEDVIILKKAANIVRLFPCKLRIATVCKL